MATRPSFIDLSSQSHRPLDSFLPSPRALPSPRLHVAGEVPPELSPLDAFAAQSRLLARQLDESINDGKRMSRLPPLAIASSLGQPRPSYFRSMSAEPGAEYPTSPTALPSLGLKTEVEAPGFRPVSVYPLMAGVPPPAPVTPFAQFDIHEEEQLRGRAPPSLAYDPLYFGARREQSPTALDQEYCSPTGNSPSKIQPRPIVDALPPRGKTSWKGPDGSLAISNYNSNALAPPRSPFALRTPSPISISMDSSDDDLSSSNIASALSTRRKLSTGSVFSTSPMSPTLLSMQRSRSMSSEISVGDTHLARPAFNFSRPLSRASASGPPADFPTRQASSDSQPSFILADETAHTPISIHSDGFPDNPNESSAATSYVYSRFSLPRGKVLQRNSLIFQDGLPKAQLLMDPTVPSKHVQALQNGAPPSPPSRPSTPSFSWDLTPTRSSPDPSQPSLDLCQPPLEPDRSSHERNRPYTNQIPGNQSSPTRVVASEGDYPKDLSTVFSVTTRANSQHSQAPSGECSADEHVTKAIQYHETGALNKSTYHLRLAARQNHPTGMLLYALACRHGWGMRPNQKEGVAWLRRAADSASLEIADDVDLLKEGKIVHVLERNTRKAQFALSIYELGVSHMNGWGIEQDKVLALRCFEIAGSWGDADALAEAGFCYAKGIGCKKDLKKSAKFYRRAESKGISMIGNSWIYKSKYNDEDDNSQAESLKSPEKKPRNKSRTRTMFGRMKSSS